CSLAPYLGTGLVDFGSGLSTLHTESDEGLYLSRRGVGALIGSMFVVGVSFGAAAPLVSSILEQRGFSEYFTGAVAAVLALAIALFSPAAGRLVERHGPGPIMSVGVLGQGLGFWALGGALATEEKLLFGARAGLGMAATLTFVAAEVALLRGVRSFVRGRVMAAYGAALATGFAGGVFFSNLAYDRLGLWCFAVIGLVAMSIAPLASWGMRAVAVPADKDPDKGHEMGPVMERFAWSPILLALCGAAINAAIDMGMSGAYPVEAQRMGMSRSDALNVVGIMFLGTVISQPLCGWLADRLGSVRVLVFIALGGALAAITAGYVSAQAVGLRAVSAAFFTIGFAAGGAYPVCLKLLADRVPRHLLPRANARFAAAYGAASFLGPLVAASAIDLVEHLGRLGWAVPTLCSLIFVSVIPFAYWDGRLSSGRA
ncbi:MAG: MFS transporter, partial [Acidobacteriota bacterium]